MQNLSKMQLPKLSSAHKRQLVRPTQNNDNYHSRSETVEMEWTKQVRLENMHCWLIIIDHA